MKVKVKTCTHIVQQTSIEGNGYTWSVEVMGGGYWGGSTPDRTQTRHTTREASSAALAKPFATHRGLQPVVSKFYDEISVGSIKKVVNFFFIFPKDTQ